MKYKLGKLPAEPDAIKFKFNKYFNLRDMPIPPLRIGHELIGHHWGILGNDKVSNCTTAGACHEHMIWTHMGTRSTGVDFNTRDALADYAAITGWDGTDETDQGATVADVASYRRRVGMIDSKGDRHKIDAYLALEPGNIDQLAVALLLTGAVGIGIDCPDNVETLFEAHAPWDITPHTRSVGGHYIPVILRNSHNMFAVVTWGGVQGMTNAFYQKYCDEAVAYLSFETLGQKGLTPDGFDQATLVANLKALAA